MGKATERRARQKPPMSRVSEGLRNGNEDGVRALAGESRPWLELHWGQQGGWREDQLQSQQGTGRPLGQMAPGAPASLTPVPALKDSFSYFIQEGREDRRGLS